MRDQLLSISTVLKGRIQDRIRPFFERNREAQVLFQKVLLYNPGDESALQGLELLK